MGWCIPLLRRERLAYVRTHENRHPEQPDCGHNESQLHVPGQEATLSSVQDSAICSVWTVTEMKDTG